MNDDVKKYAPAVLSVLSLFSTNLFFFCMFSTVGFITGNYLGPALGAAAFFGCCTVGTGAFLMAIKKEWKTIKEEIERGES